MMIAPQKPLPLVGILSGCRCGNSLYSNFNFVFALLSNLFMIAAMMTTAISTVHCQNFIASVRINSICSPRLKHVFIRSRLLRCLLQLVFYGSSCVVSVHPPWHHRNRPLRVLPCTLSLKLVFLRSGSRPAPCRTCPSCLHPSC